MPALSFFESMSNPVAFVSSDVLKLTTIYGFVQSVLWCVIITCIILKAKKLCASKTSHPPIPGLKISPFSILRSLTTLPSSRVRNKLSLPVTAFIVQTVSGHSKLFKSEKLFYFDIGPSRAVIVNKPETVEALLRDTHLLRKAWAYDFAVPWLGTGLLTSTGPKWKSRRKLLTPAFHFDILKDFLPTIDEQTRTLIDILKENVGNEFVDIVTPITLCSLDIICESTLGVTIGAQRNSKSEYVQAVLRAAQTVLDRILTPTMWFEPTFRLSAVGQQFYKDVNTLHCFTRKVIQQKQAGYLQQKKDAESYDLSDSGLKKKRKALLDLLIDHQMKHQDLSEEDIREEVDTFAFEGHDTTSMGMSWTLYLIGLYPEVQAKLHEEVDVIFGTDAERCVTEDDLRDMRYLECVLKESQRLYPSVPMFGRHVDKDQDFCGYRITKGSMLSLFTYVIHRDPETFPDPEKFDPDRFLPENCADRHPFAYVPFSAGPRNCIGQRFAVMEEKVVMANILRNFYVKSLDERDKIMVKAEMILRPAGPLRLRFTPRGTASSVA